MSYRYLALIGADGSQRNEQTSAGHEEALLTLGMRKCLDSDGLQIFVADGTPYLVMPGNRILIGHLFFNDGKRVQDAASVPNLNGHEQFLEYLLRNCWGEYLIFCHSGDDAHEPIVLRDPSGGVPAVYSIQNGSGFVTSDVSIASELKLYDRRIDWNFIGYWLTSPHLKTTSTGLSDIRELLPGCSLLVCSTRLVSRTEWSPWPFVAPDNRHSDQNEAAEHIRTVVASVVKAMAEADESILLELSGGLDSSIVAACLRETNARVVCCTLATPMPGADERQYATLMANYLGVDLDVRFLSFENARFDFIPPANAVVPGPGLLRYVVNYTLEEAGSFHDVASFFSGAGGDTVFGYLSTAAPAADAFKGCGLTTGIAAIGDLSTMHQCTWWKAARLTLKKLVCAPKTPFTPDYSFLNSLHATDVPCDHPWLEPPPYALPGDRERVFDLARTQLFRDNSSRAEKCWRRMPLLSQPVVETCLRAPAWMAIAGGRNRSIARAAFADVLPSEVLNRRSKGTFMSYCGAVYRRNKWQMRDFLATGALQQSRLLDATALHQFVASEQGPRDYSFMRVIELCMVENWLRHQN